MKCPACGAEIDSKSKVCDYCGTQITSSMRQEQKNQQTRLSKMWKFQYHV